MRAGGQDRARARAGAGEKSPSKGPPQAEGGYIKVVVLTPNSSAGPVSQAPSGTPNAILFLGKLQRTLQRTRAKVRSLSRVEAGEGVPSEVPGIGENTLYMRGGESWTHIMATAVGLVVGRMLVARTSLAGKCRHRVGQASTLSLLGPISRDLPSSASSIARFPV